MKYHEIDFYFYPALYNVGDNRGIPIENIFHMAITRLRFSVSSLSMFCEGRGEYEDLFLEEVEAMLAKKEMEVKGLS